jgi:hypothetical protein
MEYQNEGKQQIVRAIQHEFFNEFAKRETNRLEGLCKCNPKGQLEDYYRCVDSTNSRFDLPRKKLNEELTKIDTEY